MPFIISIVGLFLLKYFKKLRTKVFYWESNRQEATHIYVRGNGKKEEEIVAVTREGNRLFFTYKHLKYELLPNGMHAPVAINYEKELEKRVGTAFLASGLTSAEAA